MTPKEQARLRKKIAGMSPAELVEAHSEAITVIELIWAEAERRLCASRSTDTCPRATASAKAGAMMYDAKRFHRTADALASELGDLLPGGSGVPVAFAGSR